MDIDLIIPSDEMDLWKQTAVLPFRFPAAAMPAVGDSLLFGRTHWVVVHRTFVRRPDSEEFSLRLQLAHSKTLAGFEGPAIRLVQ